MMANYIKSTFKRDWLEGSTLVRPGQMKTYTITTTSYLIDEKTQVVGTTHEALAVGDLTDDVYCEIANPHATATIQIGVDDGGVFVPLIDIPPNYPPAIIPRLSTLAATYVQSSAASTEVRVSLIKIV